MNGLGKVFAVVFIWLATSVAWLVLGGVMHGRAGAAARDMSSRVEGLWGRAQLQRAPTATVVPDAAAVAPPAPAAVADLAQPSPVPAPTVLPPTSTDLDVTLDLDQRLKGLRWFSLYDVTVDGTWTFKNEADNERTIRVVFPLPDAQGVYDDLRFTVNGEAIDVVPEQGQLVHEATLEAGETLELEAGYASRGMDDWRYEPSVGGAVSVLRDFSLRLHTNFSNVDFPEGTLSPSTRTADGAGEHLTWSFSRIVTGAGIGMATPTRVQPGELASALSFSAPISLGFFFLVIAVLARLRKLDIHPINYMGIGGAFFAFHLLFSYSVDHLHVGAAFALASVTSVVMVTAYLRLVVSARFAFIESAAAQLVYLIGFSLAHFLEGFTGLMVTMLSVATLFLLMMLTGRIQWSKVLARPNARDRIGTPPPYGPSPVPSAVAIMDARVTAAGPGPASPYGHVG